MNTAMIVDTFQIILWTVAICVLCLCAFKDLQSRIIPDSHVLAIAVAGLGLAISDSSSMMWFSLAIAFASLLVLGCAAHFDVIGGGDAKLIAATTLLFPAQSILPLFAAIVITGGLLGCSYLLIRYVFGGRFTQEAAADALLPGTQDDHGLLSTERARIAAGQPMPYALAILAGVLFTITSEPPQCFSAIF